MSEAPISIVSQTLNSDETATINASTLGNHTSNHTNIVKSNYNSSKGWLMVGLVFIANFLVFGFFKSLGMLTKILSKEFDAKMNVYILMCITYSLNCSAGPLSCYLTRRYTARPIALVGTSLVTCGLMLSWFARSLPFLYFSIGIFTGIGSGLSYPTGVILVSNYFAGRKNAAIANALVVSGSPIGGMIMPFVISFLSELYTSRGAFLIIGGFMMHSILCVRAFRQPGESNMPTVISPDCPTPPPSPSSQSHAQHQDSKEKTDDTFSINDGENNAKIRSCSTGILTIADKRERGKFNEYGSTISAQTMRGRRLIPPSSSAVVESSGPANKCVKGKDSVLDFASRIRGAISEMNLLSKSNGAVDNTLIQHRNPHYSEISSRTGSQPYVLALDHSCMILCPSNSNTDVIMKHKYPHPHFIESVKSVKVDDSGDIEEHEISQNDPSPAENNEKSPTTWKFISPLRDPIYVSLLISNTATAISTANIYLMVSQLVNESGDDYTKTSLVYLLISSSDLTGRLMGALICDKKLATPPFIYAIGLICAGISSSFLASLEDFVHLCLGCLVYGLSSGFHVGIFGLLLTNIVGLKQIHAGYGISMFINGTIQCIAILGSGRIVSMYTKSFSWLAPIFGGILTGGGLIWTCGFIVFTKRKNSRNQSPLRNEDGHDIVHFDDVTNNNNSVDRNRDTQNNT